MSTLKQPSEAGPLAVGMRCLWAESEECTVIGISTVVVYEVRFDDGETITGTQDIFRAIESEPVPSPVSAPAEEGR